MALIDILLNPLVWIIFFESIFLITLGVLTLRSPHARTFIKLSIPFLARGKVLNVHYEPNKKSATFQLIEVKGNQLRKYSEKAKEYLNKSITKGSYYIESSSGYPFYVTVEGDNNTIDPIKGVDPSSFDDLAAKTMIQYGEEIGDYFKGMDREPEKVLGMTVSQLSLMVLIMLFGILAAMWMFAIGMSDLAAAVGVA